LEIRAAKATISRKILPHWSDLKISRRRSCDQAHEEAACGEAPVPMPGTTGGTFMQFARFGSHAAIAISASANGVPRQGRFFVAAVALALALGVACSAPAYADFQSCLADIAAAAKARGVSAATVEAVVPTLSYNPEVLDFEKQQPEFSTPIWDYVAGLVDEERVADGRAMLKQWSRWFSLAESRYGVDAAIIAAVWGVESDFGKGFGSRNVLQSLATLACAGRRPAYYRDEFIAALKIVEAGDVSMKQFNGSWAGAFGHTQFMPSTFLRLAVDLDGDGHRDLFNSVPDALGSTANYLHKSGWKPGLPWGFEVRLPPRYEGPSGRGRKQAMSDWAARGIARIDGSPVTGATPAALLLPAGPNGPAFLVTRNFDAIYSYNAAESYALAIALLSDRLLGRGPIVTPWPTEDPGLPRAQRRELQALLIQRGYDLDGKADGVIGRKTAAAIADFQARSGRKRDGRASLSVLTALRGH
jgi:lytic murein transglycosylase